MRLSDTCTRCPLHVSRKNIVWGEGPLSAPLWFFGEAPGHKEDESGRPFVPWARAGKEMQRLLQSVGILRSTDTYFSNTVKCHPPKDRDPKPIEIDKCSQWFYKELSMGHPEIIVTLGTFATRQFLPDADMEKVHGIPFRCTYQDLGPFLVIPMFHPGAGLRNPKYMLRCQTDIQAIANVWRGKISSTHKQDEFAGREIYKELTNSRDVREILQPHQFVAVDTETINWVGWLLSFSVTPGRAYVIQRHNSSCMAEVHRHLSDSGVVSLIHNAPFDLPILSDYGIHPSTVFDTMVMSYLLQSEPLGLKNLAFRYCGMLMSEYREMVAPASRLKASEYLFNILKRKWPNVAPILEIKKGSAHLRQPQNISKRIQSILKALNHPSTTVDGIERWYSIDPEEGRAMVEHECGLMPEGNLKDIPWEEAKNYSARDADATFRIFPFLFERLLSLDLFQTFEMDMGVIPMVNDMHTTGILADPEHFKKISKYFEDRMLEIQIRINERAHSPVALSSPQQVANLLYDNLKLTPAKGKKSKSPRGTDKKTLSKLKTQSTVVVDISSYREYQKLKTTYADRVPDFLGPDGRIHADFRITSTDTGRLSCANPNLMAQPVRSKEGLLIREGYVAAPGCYFVSNDYSQIEMRTLADESQDPKLIHIFTNDLDIHAQTASDMFGVPLDQVDELKHRYPAKRIGFGIVYGITESGLQEQLLMEGLDPNYWTLDVCHNAITAWYDVYKGVRVYQERTSAYALRYGYVRDRFGRIRFLPNVHAADDMLRAEAFRMAGNAPIQMGAQGVIKKAMRELTPIYRDFRAQGFVCNPLIQIHDDLLFEVSEEVIELFTGICNSVMSSVVQFSVPIKVDSKLGTNWGIMRKYTVGKPLDEWKKAG